AILAGALRSDRVEDVGAGADPGRQRRGRRLGDAPTLFALRLDHEARKHLADRHLLLVDPDSKLGGQLVEKPSPPASAGQVLLRIEPLLRLREDVRAVAPRRAEETAVTLVRRRNERLGRLLLEREPLEIEEQQLLLDTLRALAGHLDERSTRLVGG